STTLCVAVSSFTSSWRLTVISIAAPCAAGFSTSVSTIDILPPLVAAAARGIPAERNFHAGHTVQQQTFARIRLSLLVLDCIHVCASCARVENKAAAWKQGPHLANRATRCAGCWWCGGRRRLERGCDEVASGSAVRRR